MFDNSEIKEWILAQISTQKNNKLSLNNLVFVSGNSGIGKTHYICKLCEDLGLFVIYLTTNNCSTSEELNDIIFKSITSSIVQVLTNDSKQKIIIIDEFESMMAIDKTINSTLLDILTAGKLKSVPIICISSLEIVKKIGIIKKKCKIIELPNPSNDTILNVLTDLYPDKDTKYLKEIADASNGNISQSIQKIQNKSVSSSKQFDDMDENLSINMLYCITPTTFNREHIRRIMLADQWLIPLKFHENLISELQNRAGTIARKNEFYKTFMHNVVTFDTMMNNNSNAADYFASMIYQLSQLPLKKNSVSKIDNFTKILSYMSLQKKYMKKSYSTKFPLYQIGNYHIASTPIIANLL